MVATYLESKSTLAFLLFCKGYGQVGKMYIVLVNALHIRVIPVYEVIVLPVVPRFLGNSFLALNSVLSGKKVLFCTEINQI